MPEIENQNSQNPCAAAIREKRARMGTRKKRYIAALIETLGNKSMAARAAGISRQTVYQWERDDPDFKSVVDETLAIRYEDDFQFAYATAISEVRNKNWQATKFMIEFLAPHIGLNVKQEVEISTAPQTTIMISGNELGLFKQAILEDERVTIQDAVEEEKTDGLITTEEAQKEGADTASQETADTDLSQQTEQDAVSTDAETSGTM